MESSLESNQSMNEQEDSPHSGDESTAAADAPSAKTSGRAPQKKVRTVPVGETDGSRSKGEVYPPSDSWSWRKYGQKPIKGSPYPRAYYRCSSSKGCPARKQVERSRLDPTMLLITYSYEHNHPPLPTKPHHPTTTTIDSEISLEDRGTDANVHQLDMRRLDNGSPLANDLLDDLGWFSDIFMCIDEPMFVGPTWEDADMAIMLPIGEEDDALFGELGELPECSFIFRRCTTKNSYYGSTG